MRQPFGKRAAALHRIGERERCLLQNFVALLLGENVQAAEQRQPGIDQRRELTCKNHQRLRLDRLAPEERDLFRARSFFGAWNFGWLCFCAGGSSRSRCAPLLVNIRREISGLAELADRFVRRTRVNQASRFLSSRIKRDVGVTRHVSGRSR
jgi:hypothetical protein